MVYRDRTSLLTAIGVLLLLVGISAALLGPLEMYCFYLFSEGGRFHYDGFGFGSFMFGYIAAQIIGYYLIALLLIPLGYGHLRARRWARTLAVALLWSWLVVGIPLMVAFLFVLLSAKDLSPAVALIVVVLLGLSYAVAPWLLIRFYRGRNVRRTFEARDPNSYWIEGLGMPVLVTSCLSILYVVALHVPIFFNGLFPFFGTWLSGLEGILALDISMVCLVCLIWGMLRQRTWAWWGSLVYFGLLTVTSMATALKSSYSEILSNMNFPSFEVEMLQGIPLQGYHFAALIGVPLIITLCVVVLSKRHFSTWKTPRG